MLIDALKRKIAVFPNQSGQVVLAVEEDDDSCITTLCPDELDGFIKLFNKAKAVAIEIDAGRKPVRSFTLVKGGKNA